MHVYVCLCTYMRVYAIAKFAIQIFANICKYEHVCNCFSLNMSLASYLLGDTTRKLKQKGFFIVQFLTANRLLVDKQNHGPEVDAEQGAARVRLASQVTHGVARVLVSMHDTGNGAKITSLSRTT